MPHIEWKESFSVGIENIDQQNKWLVNYINKLDRIVNRGGGSRSEIRDLINYLYKYTDEHFKFEEEHIKGLDQAVYDKHRQEHIRFIKKIKIFRDDYVKGNRYLTKDMLDFLTQWLRNHIIEMDQEYSQNQNRIVK